MPNRFRMGAAKANMATAVVIGHATLLFCNNCVGQANTKQLNHQSQFWVSVNSVARLSDRWGLVADVHVRRNHFMSDPSFYFLRGGAGYFLSSKVSAVAGYAHMWLASSTLDKGFVFGNENRIYQQIQQVQTFGRHSKASLLQRIRNEQRWQQKIENGEPTNQYRFTNRFRYLISFSIPLFKNPNLPKLMLANELLVHIGKEVVYNTFDQNRLSVGIQQRLSKTLSFDLAYMHVVQQKFSGAQYDVNHTIRLFFYFNPKLKLTKHITPAPHASGEE